MSKRLSLCGICHAFGLDEVLRDVALEVNEGEVVALVGPSGCGKTTLLNMAADLLHPDEGRVESSFERSACLFQEPRLLPWKRTRDNIGWGLKARGVARTVRDARTRSLAVEVGLSRSDLEKFPHELSGGMRQRVSLARALAVQPDLLLLDEPFSALDIGLKRELHQLLLDEITRRQLSVLFITHDLMEAVRLADRILVLSANPGQLVYGFRNGRPAAQRDLQYQYTTTASLLAEPEVDRAFSSRSGN